jgi:hypothetical protein
MTWDWFSKHHTRGTDDTKVRIGDIFASEGSEGNNELLLDASGTPIEQVCSPKADHFGPQIRRDLHVGHQAAGNDLQMQVSIFGSAIGA